MSSGFKYLHPVGGRHNPSVERLANLGGDQIMKLKLNHKLTTENPRFEVEESVAVRNLRYAFTSLEVRRHHSV